MSTCDQGYEHADPDPEPVIVVEEAPDTEAPAEAAVEIARIEGKTAVDIAKIEARVEETALESRMSELEGEVRGMREVLDRVSPAPEPEPEPEPAVVEEPPLPDAPPPPADEPGHRATSRRTGFF